MSSLFIAVVEGDKSIQSEDSLEWSDAWGDGKHMYLLSIKDHFVELSRMACRAE